ncbi:hypothetical protein HK105_208957 [Polyrhizophydium stewartii]|uniref:W2 domain-containing protein n=1 Tax=Polyrhizophydium stewartii TaxID=2732419 RepID=A0ABR4MWC3_9FUNG
MLTPVALCRSIASKQTSKAIAPLQVGRRALLVVRLLSRKRDALAEAVRGLKKEVLLERDARFVVEKCLNERLCKMELELEFRDNEIVRLHDRQRRFDALDIDLDRPDDDGCLPPYQAPGSRIAAPPAHARCPLRRSQPSRQSLAIITATTTAAASAAPAIASSELSPDDIEFEHAASDHGSHADADADSDADSDASPVHPPDSHDHDDHVADQDNNNNNNNDIKPVWAHAGFRPRDPAAVAASSASHKHDDEDFGYGSEESASATVSPPRSFAEHAPEQIFQALLANVQPSMLHVDIDDLATALAAPAHDCLTAILDALVRICDLRDLWRSTDKLSAFLRRYSTVVSRFIDDEDDQLFALFALERLCVSFPARLPFFAKLVMVLFQLELVESDAVVAWHDSRAPSKDLLDVHSQTCVFVQWLEEQDDDDKTRTRTSTLKTQACPSTASGPSCSCPAFSLTTRSTASAPTLIQAQALANGSPLPHDSIYPPLTLALLMMSMMLSPLSSLANPDVCVYFFFGCCVFLRCAWCSHLLLHQCWLLRPEPGLHRGSRPSLFPTPPPVMPRVGHLNMY